MEMKDRKRGEPSPEPFAEKRQTKREKKNKLVGREGVISRLEHTNTKRMTSVLVCRNELIWVLAERCLQAFISSYDSGRMRRSQERKKEEREKLKTEAD